MTEITFIGDVHGKYDKYLKLTKKYQNTIQLGDMGFSYGYMENLRGNHTFIKGNHDNYDIDVFQDLGDFGYIEQFNLFFFRGAYSIDKQYRTVGVDWWVNEELSYQDCVAAIYQYTKVKPELVISHDCPLSICSSLFGFRDMTKTRFALETMLNIHKPKIWLFGHHHQSIDKVIDGVRFICLNELETITLDLE